MNDEKIEQRLAELIPRKAPVGLREQVLQRLEDERFSTEVAVAASASRAKALSFDRLTTMAVGLLLMVTLTAWTVNVVAHQRRLARLLGPTPAQLQANLAVEAMDMQASDDDIAAERERIFLMLTRAGRKHASVAVIHSLKNMEESPMSDSTNFFQIEEQTDENKTDRQNRVGPRGNHSSRGRGVELESLRTA
jgi:hypothetical protein